MLRPSLVQSNEVKFPKSENTFGKLAEMNRKTVKVYTIQTTNEDPPILFKDDEIDFDNCNLTEVIKFLQKLAKSPDASKLNIAARSRLAVAARCSDLFRRPLPPAPEGEILVDCDG